MRITPKFVRQLTLLFQETLSWSRVMRNRFTALLAVILLVSSAGLVYAEGTTGPVKVKVVDSQGQAVEDATVIVDRIELKTYERTRMEPNSEGIAVLEDNNILEYRVWAVTEECGKTAKTRGHLYFRGQEISIELETNENC